MAKRYKEVFDPNHSQTCICHRGPMNRGLEESPVGDFVDIEDYEELKNQLAKANERVADLEKELANKELLHVGFTNGTQVKYAKDEEGAFYPDTDGDCYIPLYMLKSHEHRVETTSIEQLRKEQE